MGQEVPKSRGGLHPPRCAADLRAPEPWELCSSAPKLACSAAAMWHGGGFGTAARASRGLVPSWPPWERPSQPRRPSSSVAVPCGGPWRRPTSVRVPPEAAHAALAPQPRGTRFRRGWAPPPTVALSAVGPSGSLSAVSPGALLPFACCCSRSKVFHLGGEALLDTAKGVTLHLSDPLLIVRLSKALLHVPDGCL